MKRMTEGIVSLMESTRVNIGNLCSVVGLHDGAPVLVIATRSNFLRLIPISTRHVAQIRVSFDQNLFRQAARVVLSEIRQRELQMVHSTGFCPLKDCCIWEGYFALTTKENIDEILSWIKKQDGVLDAEVQYLAV